MIRRCSAFFRQQADYTNAVLDKLGPGCARVRADITRLADAGSSVFNIIRVGDRLFYLERPPGANDARLMVRDNASATPRVLLDPDALAKSTGSKAHLAISQVVPSPDGVNVAVSIVPGGAEVETYSRILDVASGSMLPENFPRTWFGITAWTPDSKTVFYNQTPELKPGESENDRELRSLLYRHTLGATAPDSPILGINIDPKIPFEPIDAPVIAISPASPYAVGINVHGVQNEQTLYVAPVSSLQSTGSIPWRKVADLADAVTSFDLKGSTMYLLSHKDAARYKVLSIDLSRPEQTAANAATLVPASDAVIQQIAVAGDGL